MKKTILFLLTLAVLLSACSLDSDRTYKMILDSGEEIVVRYQKCFHNDGFVECYKSGSRSYGYEPDVVYKVIYFEVIKE